MYLLLIVHGVPLSTLPAWLRAKTVARTRRTRRVLIVSVVQLRTRRVVRVMLPMGAHPPFMRFGKMNSPDTNIQIFSTFHLCNFYIVA